MSTSVSCTAATSSPAALACLKTADRSSRRDLWSSIVRRNDDSDRHWAHRRMKLGELGACSASPEGRGTYRPTSSMPPTQWRPGTLSAGRSPVSGALARIHRCGAALGLEQGVRAVGRDGPRSIPINGAGGGLWLSLGAPMAVLGSGAGAGSAGQHAGEDNRGPGRCDSVGRLGSLVDVSGAVGAVRQAMAGLAIEPGRE